MAIILEVLSLEEEEELYCVLTKDYEYEGLAGKQLSWVLPFNS
jgi:hypothetical protein